MISIATLCASARTYSPCAAAAGSKDAPRPARPLGLYTILPSPILYGVWHKKGGVGGGGYIAQWSCNSAAIVLTMQVRGGQ